MTRRAGGWILGLLVVGAMGGGGWFALRGALNRETVAVCYVDVLDDGPTSKAILRGAEFALREENGRAGRFRVVLGENEGYPSIVGRFGTSEALLSQGHQQGRPFHVSVFDTYPLEPVGCYRISPGCEQQGSSAARWAKRLGVSRVFLLHDPEIRSKAISSGFQKAATPLGLMVEGPLYASLEPVDRILASKADLVFYSGEQAPYGTATKIFTRLREKGFVGKMVSGDADPKVSFLATRSGPLEESYLVSPFAPAPKELADRMGFVPGPHVTAGYYAMKATLDAIDRANSVEDEDLHRAAAKLPYFDAQGRATRPCALYVARNGVFEFVETLP